MTTNVHKFSIYTKLYVFFLTEKNKALSADRYLAIGD